MVLIGGVLERHFEKTLMSEIRTEIQSYKRSSTAKQHDCGWGKTPTAPAWGRTCDVPAYYNSFSQRRQVVKEDPVVS
jgi:hypothetical protein